jgi:hypothetical protein
MNEFEMGENVHIVANGKSGKIDAIGHYLNSTTSYRVQYVAGDDTIKWFWAEAQEIAHLAPEDKATA